MDEEVRTWSELFFEIPDAKGAFQLVVLLAIPASYAIHLWLKGLDDEKGQTDGR
jgi:hypothetical protein